MIISDEDKKRIWGKAGIKLFLSHLARFKVNVAKLKTNLEDFGICSFVAHEDINPGLEWQEEIKKALYTMDGFVALITDEFHESPWTDQEIGFALCREVPIISVSLGCIPKGFINSKQALSSTWDKAPLRILEILLKNPSMVDAYIISVKGSLSWDNSNKLAKILPYIEKLSPQQIDDLILAFNENREVWRSFGFQKLPTHLNRITNRNFELSEQHKIEE